MILTPYIKICIKNQNLNSISSEFLILFHQTIRFFVKLGLKIQIPHFNPENNHLQRMFSNCTWNQTESLNESNLEIHRRSLRNLANDLENKDKESEMYVIYDSVQNKSYIKQRTVPKQRQAPTDQLQSFKQPTVLQNAKNLITNIVTACRQNTIKNKILSFGTVIFHALGLEQFSWLERTYSKYTPEQLKQIPTEYIQIMKKQLNRIRFEVQTQKNCPSSRYQTLESLIQLQSIYDAIQNHQSKKLIDFILTQEKEYILTFMISAFQVLVKNYSTYKRRKLRDLFKLLEQQSKGFYNSIQVLKFLQSKDPIMTQTQTLNQLDLNLQVVKVIDHYQSINNITKMNTKIALVKVSSSPKRRRVVNLLISGFLSEDVDKRQQWNQLLACMPNSEVYGLQWQSHTINQLIKFLGISVKDLILGKDLKQLLTKDNPFVPAFEIAKVAGQLLALVVEKIFPFQFINIISYSLGSELIRSFVQKSIELNKGVNINKVITMGGVSDIDEFKKTLQKTQHSINVLNLKTKHDSVLKYILKRSKPNIKPLGLFEVDQNCANHFIQNVDVSSSIKGHFSFMTNFGTIAQLLMLNEQ